MNNFGERLRSLRIDAGYTQSALGELIGKSDSAVRMWELGRNEPDMKTLSALSAILGCSLEYLMCRENGDDSINHSPNDIPVYRIDTQINYEPVRYIPLPHKYIDGSSEYFAVIYPNSDMLPFVFPGDCIIIRKQDSALNGQLVLIKKISGEHMLRKFIYQNGGVILKPLSLDFEPDYFASEFIDEAFELLGAAVEIQRSI